MARSQVALFLVCAVVGAGLALPHEAEALIRRVHASECIVYNPHLTDVTMGTDGLKVTAPSYAAASVYCPIPDDTYFPKTAASNVNVYGYDGHNDFGLSVITSACVAYSGTVGWACGTYALSGDGFTGNFDLNPGLEAWTSAYAADFPYVLVMVPGVDGASYSYLRGIRVYD